MFEENDYSNADSTDRAEIRKKVKEKLMEWTEKLAEKYPDAGIKTKKWDGKLFAVSKGFSYDNAINYDKVIVEAIYYGPLQNKIFIHKKEVYMLGELFNSIKIDRSPNVNSEEKEPEEFGTLKTDKFGKRETDNKDAFLKYIAAYLMMRNLQKETTGGEGDRGVPLTKVDVSCWADYSQISKKNIFSSVFYKSRRNRVFEDYNQVLSAVNIKLIREFDMRLIDDDDDKIEEYKENGYICYQDVGKNPLEEI